MSETESSGPLVGQLVFPDDSEIVSRGVKASQNLAVGDPVTFDTNGFMTKASNTSTIADGLGVVVHEPADNTSGSDGDILAQAAVGNTYVFFKAGAIIKPFSLLKLNASNKAIPHTKPSDASVTPTSAEVNAARDYFGLTFGRYFGHAKEEKDPTSAVTDDVIAVRLGV